jgi:large-conductance mechanosensitive channel
MSNINNASISSNILNETTVMSNKLYKKLITNFYKFLKNKNIIPLGLAFIISININKLANDFITNIISPIVNRIFGQTDKVQLKDRVLTILGIRFELGNFLISALQFIVILYIVYFVFTLTIEEAEKV